MANVVFSWTSIHFLYVAPILFVVAFVIGIIVSLITQAPVQKKVEAYMWTKAFYDAETRQLQDLPWYQNYRVLSTLLLILTAVVVGMFW